MFFSLSNYSVQIAYISLQPESAQAEWMLPLHNGPQTFVAKETLGGHVEREV